MRLPKPSFKLKVIIIVEVLMLAINLTLGFFIWQKLSFMVREISRNKLISIAASTASMIDADTHEKIQNPEDKNGQDYRNIQAILKNIKDVNSGVDDIYTMRKTGQENKYVFVVAAQDTYDENNNGIIEPEEEGAQIGEEYDITNYPELKKAFSGPTADYKTNCDRWGCWLSGYAPIKNSSGNITAIVGVDMRADDIINFEKNTKLAIIFIIIILTLFIPLLLYLILLYFLRPIGLIVTGMENFRKDWSTRIDIRSEDEFFMIANTFNLMATELQELYGNLEKKVREKTRQLARKVKEVEKEKANDEALLESIGEGLIATDENEKIIMLNKQAEIMLGYSSKELIGNAFSQIIRLEDQKGRLLPEIQSPIQKALSNRNKTISNYLCYRKDKTKLPTTITASPIMQNGQPVGVIVVFRDITKEMEIDQAKSEFVSLASHQLRTPLTNIRWYTELLKDSGKLTKKQKKYIEKLQLSNRRMMQLINTLLNVSRIEMGSFIIEPKPLHLPEVAKEIISELQPKILEKNLKITEKYDQRLGLFNADENMVRIIFQNILTNAVKYTMPEGNISVEISIEEMGDLENVLIKITDDGIGIPEVQQSKIFTKLFRADNVYEKETDGTGLGLYIVKSVVDNSGGSIWFSSKENKGTTFYISYPTSGMKRKQGSKKLN